MATRYKKRFNWKGLISIVLIIAALVAVGAGLSVLSNRDMKKIHPVFTRGSLDENGSHVEGKSSIVTVDLFECQGLSIVTDFKFKGTYQIFFYNVDQVFVEASDSISEGGPSDIPEYAKYARIVISPVLEKNEEIKWYQVAKYANQLTIKVLKDQSFEGINYFELDLEHKGTMVCYNNTTKSVDYSTEVKNNHTQELLDMTLYCPVKPVDVEGWKEIKLVFVDTVDRELVYFFTAADGTIRPVESTQKRIHGGQLEYIIEVPEEATTFYTNSYIDAQYHFDIYRYR